MKVMVILVTTAHADKCCAKTEDSLNACAATCHVLLCISYMDGKIIKSIFTSNKRCVIWTSEERVISVLLKTAQKLSRRARI